MTAVQVALILMDPMLAKKSVLMGLNLLMERALTLTNVNLEHIHVIMVLDV